MPNRNHEYDPEKFQDHTGMVFKSIGHKFDSGWIDLFRKPEAHNCPNCGRNDRFRIIADDHPESGMMMVGCECGTWTKPFEARVPQMDDHRAKALGLYVPKLVLEFDVDVHEESN